MNQHQFETTHSSSWDEFAELLDLLERKKGKSISPEIQRGDLPERYRRLCNHYGLAKARHYSPALVDQLHVLVLRGYNQLYSRQTNFFWSFLTFVGRDFPAAVRKFHVQFWLAFLLFFGPALAIGVATYHDSSIIYSIMSEGQVFDLESMYSGGAITTETETGRDAESDFTMFGFYILNNISIGFRTFAGGILFGVGSVFLLVYNGLFIGGASGHLSHPPYSENFWQFVAGHGSFELIAIVICGAAGLLLGKSLIKPENYKRTEALKKTAPDALKLVMGGALMLVIAAFVEAFWSSSSFAPKTKYIVASLNWILVFLYLLFVGKTR